ncbi:MAG: LamG domain-containing protein, partial [Flavobacteriaceae bacterium]|nr:LamG domain-containing protein [Flavobacteriaceae bacterium]
WKSGLYVVPNVGAGETDYPGSGVTGSWSVVSSSNISCGNTAVFSSATNPKATFSAEPGTYTLRWTLANGCSDDIVVTVSNCNSINFDGVNDFVTLKNNYILDSAFTAEVWVKTHDISGTQTVFAKRNSTETNRGYNLNIENGTVKFYWYSATGNGSISSTHKINSSRWYHIAVAYDGSTYKLYIDGIDLGTISGTVKSPSATDATVETIVGGIDQSFKSDNNIGNLFYGWMDELRIWNKALTPAQIRQMMNQEIESNGTAVRGTIVPLNIPGLNWADLDGYYRMTVDCGNLGAFKGVGGRLRNITTAQANSAPLPYTSRVDNKTWGTDDAWTHFTVWDAPNSLGIDGSTYIDWNIVQLSHNMTSGNKDITVLGLISDNTAKTLTMSDPGTSQNENNDGQGLRITHYLKMDGNIDLMGESQLVQDEGSILDVASAGKLERDQQGTSNMYNYNYWSSPVSPVNTSANNLDYTVDGVLNDGTNSSSPVKLQWTNSYDANAATNPKTLSRRWIYSYEDFPENSYSNWNYLNETGSLSVGVGYTMKGSGAGGSEQNYVFIGKPNNGTITNSISSGYQTLVGNPYPSAIDADEFIKDNVNGTGNGSIDGTIYFWEHYNSNITHILEDYEGSYSAYNLTGGVSIVIPDGISGQGTSAKTPGRYIPVGQGFFVTASTTGGNVAFNNDQRIFMREAVNTSVFMEANNQNAFFNDNVGDIESLEDMEETPAVIQRIRLSFVGPDGLRRPLLLGFTSDNAATDGFDYGYDALHSDEFNNDLFFMIDNDKYVIQGVGQFNNSKQYPLGMFLDQNGSVKVQLDDTENFGTAIDVFIYDSELNTYTLLNETDFNLDLDTGDYTNRFFVTFKSVDESSDESTELEETSDLEDTSDLEEEELDSQSIKFLQSTNEIFITGIQAQEINSVKLINLLGQNVMNWNNLNSLNSSEIRLSVQRITTGQYIIQVNTKTKTYTKKTIISQ